MHNSDTGINAISLRGKRFEGIKGIRIGIRLPENRNFFFVKSGIRETFAHGIRNLGLWNPEYRLRAPYVWKSESIPTDKDLNPVPGIWNPQREIQNPSLSWITLHKGCFCASSSRKLLRTLRFNDADGNEKVKKKTDGFISKTTTLHVRHACLYIFLHDYDVQMPNFAFYGVCKQVTTKFYFSLWTGIWSLEFNSKRIRLHLTEKVGRNNCDKDWKNANSFLKRRSRCRRVVGSKSYWKRLLRGLKCDVNVRGVQRYCIASNTRVFNDRSFRQNESFR